MRLPNGPKTPAGKRRKPPKANACNGYRLARPGTKGIERSTACRLTENDETL